MTEEDWKLLLPRIRDGKCTPFLGAGVNYGLLPLGGQIAREWAKEEEFPMRSHDDLPSVAQFIAAKYDSTYTKETIIERLRLEPRPDFEKPDERLECLRTLAELPLPIYLTTNYDDLMVEALRHSAAQKEPRREFCRWHDRLKSIPQVLGGASKYEPTPTRPLVFHLHGSDEYVNSLVLTEDDYLDFLVSMSRSRKILPPRIEEALSDASLLFIGYSLRDINFRVIHRGLVQSTDGSLRRVSVTVQMRPPDDCGDDPTEAEKYLTKYFGKLDVRVYWGTASEFAKELRDRWRGFR
jgi:hypothetical protein